MASRQLDGRTSFRVDYQVNGLELGRLLLMDIIIGIIGYQR